MKYADLHIHSNYSDGIKSPEEIIDSAIKDNIKYISITDHDSISVMVIRLLWKAFYTAFRQVLCL